MPVEIRIFTTVEEAVSILQDYNKPITKKEMSKEQIVRESVSSNIYRAFRGSPSLIYREWASRKINDIIQNLNNIITKEEYDKHLFEWIYDFIDYWSSHVKTPDDRIIFGPASKIVNLLIKMLNESTHLNNEKIYPFFHVPFDKYSLKPLIKIINDLTGLKYRIDIPKDPSMKYISTPELYCIVQKAVFNLCSKANINPILYDYWCWDEKH